MIQTTGLFGEIMRQNCTPLLSNLGTFSLPHEVPFSLNGGVSTSPPAGTVDESSVWCNAATCGNAKFTGRDMNWDGSKVVPIPTY